MKLVLHRIGDVANWKRHQQLDEILRFFYPHYIAEIINVVFKKTLSCNTPTKLTQSCLRSLRLL